LKHELENATPTSLAKRTQDPVSWLPKAPARHSLESHRDTILCIAFHPIYSSIASGSSDCTLKIWDWELGELERTIKAHTRAVLDVDYGGPRGATLLASCSSDLTIKLWDPSDDYKNIRTLQGHDHSVSAVRFIRSGTQLVSASADKNIKVWDVATGYCLQTISGHAGWVRDVCPSEDGRFLLSAGNDQTARLWDISTLTNTECKFTMFGHENVVQCCAIAPPSTYPHFATIAGLKKPPPASSTAEFMATGSRDKTIKLWDGRGMCLKTLIGHDNWVNALVFHPGGKYLLSVADDKSIRCWDLTQDGKCVKVISNAHDHFVTCLRWAPGQARDTAATNNEGDGGHGDEKNGTSRGGSSNTLEPAIRCIIATGGVDTVLKIFAN
jgi:platelet-activating factor acetylhydrolase IB subunit alpha